MLPKINRTRPWLACGLSLLLIIVFFPYSINIYASNDNATPLVLALTQKSLYEQKFQAGAQSDKKGGGFSVGVNVDLVMMYTSVFDKEGLPVRGLNKEDFNVYEDGVRQEIESFSQEDAPISMGIVIDTSSSMDDKIEEINRAAYAFLNASNPQDEVFLVGFNDEVELLHPFTSDKDEISDELENAIIDGGTALYDAIFLGVEEARKGGKSRKTIVVITDGVDKDSTYSVRELIASVQEADVQVFNIGFIDEKDSKDLFGGWFKKSDGEKARDALKRISEETGGKAFFPEDISEIHAIVAEIARELRNQYSIGYFSSNTDRDGSWRRVVIKLDLGIIENPKLRHRRGYYAPKGQSAVDSR